MIEWSLGTLEFLKSFHVANQDWMDSFAAYNTGHLGLVGKDGAMELYDGNLRAIDSSGKITLNDVPDFQYADYFAEEVKSWSYMKFPYIKHLGRENGSNRVGPLARINICDKINTPLAEMERREFMAYTGNKPNNMTMHTHLARVIEILHCAEVMKELLHDEDILGDELVRKGTQREHGVGIIEAPRGTLIHDYEVDKSGKVRKCNLIVSTTHNNAPMNEAVNWVAKKIFDKKQKVTDVMLNQIEVAIRAYDPV